MDGEEKAGAGAWPFYDFNGKWERRMSNILGQPGHQSFRPESQPLVPVLHYRPWAVLVPIDWRRGVSKLCRVFLSKFNLERKTRHSTYNTGMSVKDVHWDPQRIIGQAQACEKTRMSNISEHQQSVQCHQAITGVSSLGRQIKRSAATTTSIHFITPASGKPTTILT